MDAAQGRLSRPMPDAVPVPDAPRWFSQRCAGLPAAGASPRSLLRRLLLGSYGAFVCGRGDERALDCAPGAARPSGETYSVRTVGRARRRLWRNLLRTDGRSRASPALLVSPQAPGCCYLDRSDESSAYSLPRANFRNRHARAYRNADVDQNKVPNNLLVNEPSLSTQRIGGSCGR